MDEKVKMLNEKYEKKVRIAAPMDSDMDRSETESADKKEMKKWKSIVDA